MNVDNLMNMLGSDVELVTRSDQWLEEQRKAVASKMNDLASELRAIMLAQRIKTLLQQRNMVAINHILRDEDGRVTDMIIRILNLPDAISLLGSNKNKIDKVNRDMHINSWNEDGYDVETSATLRSA